MAATLRIIYLPFDLNEIADRGLEPGKLRLMRRQTVNMGTRFFSFQPGPR